MVQQGQPENAVKQKGSNMNKLWNSIKWLAGTLALFGAFMLGDMLRGDPITLRHYIAAAGMAGFSGINSLPLK